MKNLELVRESELFQALSKKLGQKETKMLISYVNGITKEETGKLVSDKDLMAAKLDIIERLQKVQSSLLTWLIVLWLSTLGVVITLSVTLFK